MTKFNPDNKESLTYRECLGPAMEITDEDDARQYLAAYIEFTQKALDASPREDGMTAEQIVKTNLGYYAGYYNTETRERVERLFMCSHPVFGSIEENGQPNMVKAINAGRKRARMALLEDR